MYVFVVLILTITLIYCISWILHKWVFVRSSLHPSDSETDKEQG